MNRSSTRSQIAARAASLVLVAVLLAPALVHADALPLRIADPTANEKLASGDFFSLPEGNVKGSLSLAAEKRWGNDYMHARYYSPNLGRFLSVDPVGGEVGSSQSWNRYSYVKNNPVVLFDPTGRKDKRSDYDKAITEDVDVMAAVLEITENMDLDNKFLSERFEFGAAITDEGNGDFGASDVFTSGRPRSITFGFLQNPETDGLWTMDKRPVVATIHGHPAISGLVDPFSKSMDAQRYSGAAVSKEDRELGNETNRPAYVVVTDQMLLKYDPETKKSRRILTKKDYKEFLKRARAATQSFKK